MGGGGIGLPTHSEADVMAALLSEGDPRGGEEPPIAASIVQQMLHMELTPLPRSIRVRIRDVIERLEPERFIEVGAGIGHLSAWLLDLWSSGHRPKSYVLAESGSRFAVVLQRLIERHECGDWVSIVTEPWPMVTASALSAAAASATALDASTDPVLPPVDAIVVHGEGDGRVAAIEASLPLLRIGGVLLTPEPLVPIADVGEPIAEEPLTQGQLEVKEFNDWIALVKRCEETHSLGFVECTGGALVAFRRR